MTSHEQSTPVYASEHHPSEPHQSYNPEPLLHPGMNLFFHDVALITRFTCSAAFFSSMHGAKLSSCQPTFSIHRPPIG